MIRATMFGTTNPTKGIIPTVVTTMAETTETTTIPSRMTPRVDRPRPVATSSPRDRMAKRSAANQASPAAAPATHSSS